MERYVDPTVALELTYDFTMSFGCISMVKRLVYHLCSMVLLARARLPAGNSLG